VRFTIVSFPTREALHFICEMVVIKLRSRNRQKDRFHSWNGRVSYPPGKQRLGIVSGACLIADGEDT
jgi:hypothetical protein